MYHEIISDEPETCDALNAIHQQGIIHGDLAPEQLLSSFGVIGPATDFFALGATAYWYAFGRSIYAGSSQTDFWQSMLDESTIAMPSNENDWLRPFIQNCLIKSVSQRPQSIEELRDLIAIRRD